MGKFIVLCHVAFSGGLLRLPSCKSGANGMFFSYYVVVLHGYVTAPRRACCTANTASFALRTFRRPAKASNSSSTWF